MLFHIFSCTLTCYYYFFLFLFLRFLFLPPILIIEVGRNLKQFFLCLCCFHDVAPVFKIENLDGLYNQVIYDHENPAILDIYFVFFH